MAQERAKLAAYREEVCPIYILYIHVFILLYTMHACGFSHAFVA